MMSIVQVPLKLPRDASPTVFMSSGSGGKKSELDKSGDTGDSIRIIARQI